jgi:hypothetical protein
VRRCGSQLAGQSGVSQHTYQASACSMGCEGRLAGLVQMKRLMVPAVSLRKAACTGEWAAAAWRA